ncbi:MAG TPA: hypothetical protein VGO93_30665 [Candidatus Xenobia bacterium]|jgi:hypothetical protein
MCSKVGCLLMGITGGAWAQLRLPPTDGRGEPLAPPEPLALVIHHQQTIIYLLIGVIVASLLVNGYLATVILRAQFTLERMAEAIRRVDLLAEAFRVAQVEWEEKVEDAAEPQPTEGVVDLDEEPQVRSLS